MLRLAFALIIAAFLFEFARTKIFDNDFDSITVLVEGVDQSCVVQRKLTSGLLQSSPMPCATAHARAARDTGTFGLEVAYLQVAHFSYRSPVDQRTYTGIHRTKAALSPVPIGRSLEIRVSRTSPGRYKMATF
jgi:hypothetical protein